MNEDIQIVPGASGLPVEIRALRRGMSADAFVESHRAKVDELLTEVGAVLFRGFAVRSAAQFEKFVQSVSPDLLTYTYRSTPRSSVTERIYTATEYPPEAVIPMHCENAYQRDWPMKLMFQCVVAPRVGGETPLADVERVTARIGPDIVGEFAERGVTYVRTYGTGVDLPWQTVFQTESASDVEAFCRDHAIECEWLDDGRLRTRQRCQGVAQHPVRKTVVFFNQAALFHYTSLDPKTRSAMLEVFDEQSLPRNAYFGDGGKIPESVLGRVREAFEAERVAFPWQAGDALVVDNMRVAHGRNPFSGPRKIHVAMAEARSQFEARSAPLQAVT